MYWHTLCLLAINASKGFNMNVTSTTQTQYVAKNSSSTKESTSTEYKKSTDVVEKKQDEHKWIRELSSDVNTLLKNASSNSSTSFKSGLIKDEIETKINQYASKMMEENGDNPKTELETSKLLNEYKKELLQEYKVSIESSTDTQMSAQQEAMIKVLMTENTQESSSLATLLATKSGTIQETQETEATGKMAEMQEKYKDVYTPIPEEYTKGSEELQQAKIYEAYPNYVHPNEVLKLGTKIYIEEFGGKPIKLGDAPLSEVEKANYQAAFDKAFEMFGGLEAFNKMQDDVYQIKKDYPINSWGKDERNTNSKELARFHNAVVYEDLERGKTIDEARIHAGYLTSTSLYMNSGFKENDFIDILEKAGLADPDAKQDFDHSVDFNAQNNTNWDLREYGIEGRWQENNIYENDEAMIAEIEKKIGQFGFMLNNEDLIKEANSKLDPHYQTLGQANHYKEYITQKHLPEAEFALDIFKKYNIYN